MRIVTCLYHDTEHLALLVEDKIYLCSELSTQLPTKMQTFLQGGNQNMVNLKQIEIKIKEEKIKTNCIHVSEVKLLAPVPHPSSCRDAYAFRQHVSTSRRNRGLEMIPEFDQFPVFYFTNHQAIYGPGDIPCMPLHMGQLDFELEVAIVINKRGKNIKASEADEYIAGYMIMNDISARKLQMEEMKLNLGPAKGKDFATVIGPWLVTKDELQIYKTNPPEGHIGDCYNLEMTCKVNDKQVSLGNLADMDWTFAEIIERASYGVELFPGDVIGSGTVGTGCFLELNGTGRLQNPTHIDQWLVDGDNIALEVTGLGRLDNRIILLPD
ncbi:fumarylacetoacetate hydrolase family protein [Sphingobacterium lumbrici]|uniref:fumarylacetoacetate hydrolase family protein n=1 Tax=Sphingobacterium lumbrici TaxID=2559600 RepID=UPI001128B997|nr:fumarylacetoacetate hydrolase family protein [Sphingobacterium lumbrici]